MSFENLAQKCKVKTADFQDLIYGQINPGIAEQLNVPTQSLQNFIYGQASEDLAKKMGISTDDLQFLLYQKGGDTAIGIIVGLLFKESENV